ncbi:hypothetical protein GCM10007049_03540 [Echinicola pacifica]|uniref:Phosphoenolpyruvate carboxykinase (ATP) n=1 Tax=Echinicola pacifica TaxID=346377 RepID=A0A918PL92_9BACT|nr:phosphoenolpyruvate carboxykinase (ATP) [Echinicola pacifica]GGZ14845.1 hypothetical protein GCM10007049_03540 [Echinicola pacifica]
MITTKNPTSTLGVNGLSTYPKNALHNLCASSLVEEALLNKEGKLSSSGALMVNTGTYTGRSPKDRFIVKEPKTKDHIWWGNINLPLEESFFALLHRDMLEELSSSKIYSRDAFVGADRRYRKSLRVFTSLAWHNLFCLNMFLRPEVDELAHFSPEYTIICLPEFEADPRRHGTRGKNFTVINLEKKLVLIGGLPMLARSRRRCFR